MIDVGYGAAFLAGLLSFFSPCVLPIVPPYLAYLAGMSFNEVRTRMPTRLASRRIALASIAFVLGFTTVFVSLGATASVIGQSLARYFDTLQLSPASDLVDGPAFSGRIPLCAALPRSAGSGRAQACGHCWRLCHGAGLCLWLDALRGADPGGDPVHGCGKGDRGAGGAAARALRARNRHSLCHRRVFREPFHCFSNRFKKHMA
jgi:hypothetical protein